MKKLININILIIMFTTLLFTGCNWIDSDLNIDPDKPSDVPVNLLLPSCQTAAAYALGGNTSVRTTNIWMQYFDGVSRQSLAEARYNITSADVNNFWVNTYTQSMMDAKAIIKKADEGGSPHYSGIAKVMLAVNLGTMTNLYGDVPYSDAFGGAEAVLQPTFDSQADIYNTLNALLTSAVTDLGQANNAFEVSGDLFYDGNTENWTKAAYALQARYLLYKKDYAGALTAIDNAFTGITDDFEFGFGETESTANPLYQFMATRTDIRMSSTFIDKLDGDPRLPFYAEATTSGDYVGSVPGSENSSASKLGTYNAAKSSAVVLSSYAEMMFIKAECLMRTEAAGAADAYKAAVAASIMKVTGDANTDWLDANVNSETDGSLTLDKIMAQKYLAMYSTVVPYDDWRRTGYPTLAEVAGATQSTPVRFPYPQSEVSYNNNCSFVPVSQALWIFQ